MSFDKNQIIREFSLSKFGNKGYYGSKHLKCPKCGRSDKFGINFELNKVHCFYDDYRDSIKFFLIKVDRRDLITGGEEKSVSWDFPILGQFKPVQDDKIDMPIKTLPVGFKRLIRDNYLDDRNFLPRHYDMFRVGETKLYPSLKNCIIFQFFDKKDNCIAWMSRSRMSKEWHKDNLERYKQGQGSLVLRYNNSPNTDFSRILGGEQCITGKIDTLVIVEGIMDKAGVDKKLDLFNSNNTACVFTFGNSISMDQVDIINSYPNISDIYLLYDYGTVRESKEAGSILLNNTRGKKINICHIRDVNSDPGDMGADRILDCMEESVDCFSFNLGIVDGIR